MDWKILQIKTQGSKSFIKSRLLKLQGGMSDNMQAK